MTRENGFTMIAAPVANFEVRRGILEATPAEARKVRIGLGLELADEEIEARRRRLCRKPEPKFEDGLTFTAYLKTPQGEMIERECKIISHRYSFSRQWGQTLFYQIEGGAQVLEQQIERAMNPALARPRYLDYCADCE